MLRFQDLRVGQEKEPCIGFTQENLIAWNLVNRVRKVICKVIIRLGDFFEAWLFRFYNKEFK